MKKLLLFAVLLATTLSYSQGSKTVDKINEIKGQWILNENKLPIYSKITNNVNFKKKELLIKIEETLNFNTKEKYDIFKTTENTIHFNLKTYVHSSGYGDATDFIYAYYSGIINVKDNKFKTDLILTRWIVVPGISQSSTYNVKNHYPLNNVNKTRINMFGKSFYKQHKKISKYFEDIESSVLKTTAKNSTINNW